MEKIYKASRVNLPFYWWFVAPPIILIISLITSVILFSKFDDATIIYILFLFFIVLLSLCTYLAKLWLQKQSYLLLTNDGTLSYHSITGTRWKVLVNDIEALDEKPGEYRKSASATGLQAFVRTEFVIKSKNGYYSSYIRLQDWDGFIRDVTSLNASIVLKDLYSSYNTSTANKVIIDDTKLYSSGSKLMRYLLWGIGTALVLFCLYIVFLLR